MDYSGGRTLEDLIQYVEKKVAGISDDDDEDDDDDDDDDNETDTDSDADEEPAEPEAPKDEL